MSMPIERQSAQYDVFDTDRWNRDRQASYDESEVADMLRGPSIHAGLLDTRRTSAWGGENNYGPPGPLNPPEYYDEGDGEDEFFHNQEHGLDQQPPEDPYGGHAPETPLIPLDLLEEHRQSTGFDREPPPHFNAARHLAEDGGPALEGAAFNPNLFSPGDKLNGKSQLFGDEDRWVTALAAPMAQPTAPTPPVWLGHTFAPGHRVGMPWRDTTIPGTVTHLEGTNVGVRWDDGQHSVEEPAGIRPLH